MREGSDAHKLHATSNTNYEEMKGVVIDGTNVITKSLGNDQREILLARLQKVISNVEALGWNALVGIRQDAFHIWRKKELMPREDLAKLELMVDNGKIDLLSGQEDDYHLINTAINGPYYLLSNDNFKFWKKENKSVKHKIEKVQIKLNWLGDEPSFNLPANGKSTVVVGENSLKGQILLTHIDSNSTCIIKQNINIGRHLLREKFSLIGPEYVSGNHLRFYLEGKEVLIEDLKSKNGTYIGEFRLAPNHPQPILSNQVFSLARKDRFTVQLLP